MLTQESLKKFLQYDQNTGLFRWISGNKRRVSAGDVAGSANPSGYIRIIIQKKTYLAHRLAWLYVYGVMPPDEIDHINHIPDDNRIENLRVVSNAENMRNQKMRSTNTSGVIGVCMDKRDGKWQASIMHKGKRVSLGNFTFLDDAAKARKEAEAKYGYHKNHGRKV